MNSYDAVKPKIAFRPINLHFKKVFAESFLWCITLVVEENKLFTYACTHTQIQLTVEISKFLIYENNFQEKSCLQTQIVLVENIKRNEIFINLSVLFYVKIIFFQSFSFIRRIIKIY